MKSPNLSQPLEVGAFSQKKSIVTPLHTNYRKEHLGFPAKTELKTFQKCSLGPLLYARPFGKFAEYQCLKAIATFILESFVA